MLQNMNYEDAPKHTVTNKAILTLKQVMEAQDEFGIRKYGKELNHRDNYDWMKMFLEEFADGLKYIQCEIENKQEVILILKGAKAVKHHNKDLFIDAALDILTKSNTGK